MYLRLLHYTGLSSKDLRKKKQYIQASWMGLEGDALKIVSLGFFCVGPLHYCDCFVHKYRDGVGIMILLLFQKAPIYYASAIEAGLQLPSEGQ